MTLKARISCLEKRSTPRGPLLISWLLDPYGLATTEYEGERLTQARSEARHDFFARIGQLVSPRAVVWVDQLNERL